MSAIGLMLLLSLVRAEQYSDYVGASMPQYSIEEDIRDAPLPSEDYLEQSPDAEAPIPFDYKYEENLREKDNKLTQKYEEDKRYHPNKKSKYSPNNSDDYDEQEHEEATVPKLKTSRKMRGHRTRLKDKELDEEQINYRQKAQSDVHNRRIYKDDIDITNDYYGKDKTLEDNSKKSADINYRQKKNKVIRRKPRDRSINYRQENVDFEDLKSLGKGDVKPIEADNMNDESEYVPTRRKKIRRVMDQKPVRPVPEKTNMRNKNYPEYEDNYFDMKRVNDMKNRLPDLLRRTQASNTETIGRPEQDFRYRRADVPDQTTITTSNTSNTSNATVQETIITESTNTTIMSNTTELSLAEKSRLSILKKVNRKNEIKDVGLTTKPPVLMQVTQQLHTLVMVEPVSLGAPVVEDTPERIAKAKKLMRQKLMAGARSIHDLTDNWDEMVCDYIDVSLLDASPLAYPTLWMLFIGSLICLNWSNVVPI
ncbi:uncharacterized protein LOC112045503 [Bicyclus anynana]|uniref:Uncharacterized protein LOC112045503 n=1 Tax=Bicyclus anynana TaxID=110368 RepID=A0A6J1N3I8_BICAN|nr:uncharacterized protein LOC112045503 [Bicyclus anynana]